MDSEATSSRWRKFILILNCITLGIGYCGGPLISRLYFLHGGQRIWLSSWLASAGWPITFTILIFAYFFRRSTLGSDTKFVFVTRQEFISSTTLGILVGLAGYLYAWGPAKLPVSTSTVIYATQLGFTVVFAFLIVKQKLTPYSANAVILLMVGAGMLAIRADSDRPSGESTKQYILGFVMTLLAAASTGLAFPLLELIYVKCNNTVNYTMVLEIQTILCFFATAFCTIGMIVNKDFQAISREAREFELGETKYYLVLVWSAIIWQFSTLGTVGVIQYGSSLLCGILTAFFIPVTELLGVLLYHEKFQATKGVAIFLALWGFVSYLYGEMKLSKKQKIEDNLIPQIEMAQTVPV